MTVHEPDNQPPTGISATLAQYFVDISVSCPYGLPQMAVYHQALFGKLDDDTVGTFLEHGYRRNGNCIYAMRCPNCQECVPIRIKPEQFAPNRNQKRVWKKNRDVKIGVAPLAMSDENLDVLDKFLTTRFPDGQPTAEDYYEGFFLTSVTRCFEIRYRIKDRLMGVAIVDGSREWLNAVYYYFDPEFSQRSPGTLNILQMVHFCKRNNIGLLNLGYWIQSLPAMRYKSAFKPHEIYIDDRWQEARRR